MNWYQLVLDEVAKTNHLAQKDSLHVLELARKEVYFDLQQNESDKKNYYKNIAVNTTDPRQLFTRLSDLVKRTHTTRLTYDDARRKYLYPKVDLQPNGMLKSIYSGEEFSPEKIIAADLAIKEKVIKQAVEQFSGMSTMNHDAFQEHIRFLEADATYNAEHSVPQSWFGKKDPMKADLHHLFTCETACNEFRGNLPFFDFPAFGKTSRPPGCGKRDETRFEPSLGRGAVARATLYFLLRYPGEINNNLREYTKDGIQVLLKWHHEEPVGQYELHRNAETCKVQGNRNPLIDFPEWVNKIDFSLGLG